MKVPDSPDITQSNKYVTAMEIAAFVVSVIAVVVAGGSLWYARGQKLAADQSADEARRSADAAQEATGYQRQEVERNRVVFRLNPVFGGAGRYVLSNEGTDSAYGVHVDPRELALSASPDELNFDEFGSGHEEVLMLARDMRTQTTHVEVMWHHQPDRSDKAKKVELFVE